MGARTVASGSGGGRGGDGQGAGATVMWATVGNDT